MHTFFYTHFPLETLEAANEQKTKNRGKKVYLLNCLLLKSRDGIVSNSSVAENEQRLPPLQRFYFSSINTTIEQNRIQEIAKINEKLGEKRGKMPTFDYTPFFPRKPYNWQLNRKNQKGGKFLPSESFVVEKQIRVSL